MRDVRGVDDPLGFHAVNGLGVVLAGLGRPAKCGGILTET